MAGTDRSTDAAQALGRLRMLRYEITTIAELNEAYRRAADSSIADLQAHEQRRERLREIVEELRNMRVGGTAA
jgi:hypothetical protein